MGLFGKTPQKDPKEQIRDLCRTVRTEGRKIDRQIRTIRQEEQKVKVSLKDAAKKGHKDVCGILAKEIVQSRRAVSKLYSSKAQLNSVELSMKNQQATLRVAGSLGKSADVMRYMQSLIKVPEIQASMQELSKEMMKAGIIEEMIEDTFEGMEDDGVEEEAQEEVDKILFEVTNGILGQAGTVATESPSAGLSDPIASTSTADAEDDDDMHDRLAALRS